MKIKIVKRGLMCLAVWAAVVAVGRPGPDSAATQAVPARVLIIGDSMMCLPSHALELALAGRTGVTTRAYASIGTGLARLDSFDWMEKTRSLLQEFNPDMTLVWFGTNDRQPMQTTNRIVKLEEPEWEVEYAGRVNALMTLLLSANPTARVMWLELPDMRDEKIQADVLLINRLVQAEAEKHQRVEFFGTREILGFRAGKFTPYVIGSKGLPVQVRDPDGIHLNRAGADRLAEYIVKAIYETPSDAETSQDR